MELNCREMYNQVLEQCIRDHKHRQLGIITVGNDLASEAYVRGKKTDCQKLGYEFIHKILPEDSNTDKMIDALLALNGEVKSGGIMVQLPVPRHINMEEVLMYIPDEKDVDCMTTRMLGRMFDDDLSYLPCTPAGILKLLDMSDIELRGARCCIIGKSRLVGMPLAILLMQRGATVTSCNSATVPLWPHTKDAEIIITATGQPGLITPELLNPAHNQVLIDVGITRLDGKLVGDVDPLCYYACKAYTPVPGGVGLMTRAALMENLTRGI